jgi:hypothetical protein
MHDVESKEEERSERKNETPRLSDSNLRSERRFGLSYSGS